MDYEKLYKEAIERAKSAIKECGDNKGRIAMIESIFPELRKSDDEKIRKNIKRAISVALYYSYFDKETADDCLAWLEKQGEQKPIDKAEPKFKVGDWIVSNGKLYVYQIEEINEFVVKVREINGETFVVDVKCLNDAHLWTIQDAKDGDVIVCEDYGYTSYLLLKSFSDKTIELHCWYNGQTNNLHNGTEVITREDARIHPATKEQRDTLMKAMADAGYTFDFEKKELKLLITNGGDFELKSCPQVSDWSEEDEAHINSIIDYLLDYKLFVYEEDMNVANGVQKELDWLEALKQKKK